MSVHDLPVPPAPVVPPRTLAEMINEAENDRNAQAADDNPFKLVARYRKARKVADALLHLGATVDSIPGLEGEQSAMYRRLAAEVAGTRVPSETTWALVVELVRERTES